MILFWLLILGAGIYLLVKLTTGRAAGGNQPSGSQSSEEILKQRYARGEISREDYVKLLEDLRR